MSGLEAEGAAEDVSVSMRSGVLGVALLVVLGGCASTGDREPESGEGDDWAALREDLKAALPRHRPDTTW